MDKQTGHTRILIVDDDADDYYITSEYIRSIPSNNYTLMWSRTYADGMKQLLEGSCDLCLVDYRLGAKTGLDFLKEAIANSREEPIVLLTGQGNYKVDLTAMQLGAVDYLIKTELTIEKVERSLRYALERADSTKALKANERRYRNIFEKSKDIVFVTDKLLRFVDVNEAANQILGYSRDELLQMNLTNLVAQQADRDHLLTIMATQAGLNDWETLLNTKSGQQKWCMMSLSCELDSADIGYVQGIIHDITNLKLEEKAKLQSEKLAAAHRLVRTIAHEVRNPLNNITLSIEQLLHGHTDADLQLYLDIILRNSKRISNLISELLNSSRPAENTLHICPLQQIIAEVVSASKDRMTLKKISLEVACPEAPTYIMADGEKLKLALLNIVTNAIEAMEEQVGALNILLQEMQGQAILSITDNGSGISKEHISRLFEPYFTQKRNGIGLGLTFTLNILQAHKAQIDVTSDPGYSTNFTIRFPTVLPDKPILE